VSGDKSLSVVQIQQFGVSANALRRPGPDGVEHGVEQIAALRGGQAGLGWLPSCAARRAVAKALKGHCDCAVRTFAPPLTLPGGKGMRLRSSKEQ
jgi:hypothetical protein